MEKKVSADLNCSGCSNIRVNLTIKKIQEIKSVLSSSHHKADPSWKAIAKACDIPHNYLSFPHLEPARDPGYPSCPPENIHPYYWAAKCGQQNVLVTPSLLLGCALAFAALTCPQSRPSSLPCCPPASRNCSIRNCWVHLLEVTDSAHSDEEGASKGLSILSNDCLCKCLCKCTDGLNYMQLCLTCSGFYVVCQSIASMQGTKKIRPTLKGWHRQFSELLGVPLWGISCAAAGRSLADFQVQCPHLVVGLPCVQQSQIGNHSLVCVMCSLRFWLNMYVYTVHRVVD